MSEHPNPRRLLNGQYVLLTFINFLVSVSYSMVSTIMARYLGSVGLTIAVAGAITGSFSIASMVARPFTGVINDRFNRKALLIGATAGMALCTLFYGASDAYGVLLFVRLMHGMFFAFSSTVNMAVIPELVPENRVTEGISYYGVVQSLGVAAGPSVGLWLINLGGYQVNFAASGALAMAGAAIALTLRPFQRQVRPSADRWKLRWTDIIAVECLAYAAVDVAIAMANGLENSMITLYGAAQGIANIGWYFTISAVVLCVTRVLFGRLADRKGVAFSLYPGLALIILGFLILWQARAPWIFAVASVVKTLGVGLARPAIQAACVKAVPAARRGSASSTYYIGSDIGQGTSPAIGGRIVDLTGNYGLAFALFTIPLALGAAIFAWFERKRA